MVGGAMSWAFSAPAVSSSYPDRSTACLKRCSCCVCWGRDWCGLEINPQCSTREGGLGDFWVTGKWRGEVCIPPPCTLLDPENEENVSAGADEHMIITHSSFQAGPFQLNETFSFLSWAFLWRQAAEGRILVTSPNFLQNTIGKVRTNGAGVPITFLLWFYDFQDQPCTRQFPGTLPRLLASRTCQEPPLRCAAISDMPS